MMLSDGVGIFLRDWDSSTPNPRLVWPGSRVPVFEKIPYWRCTFLMKDFSAIFAIIISAVWYLLPAYLAPYNREMWENSWIAGTSKTATSSYSENCSLRLVGYQANKVIVLVVRNVCDVRICDIRDIREFGQGKANVTSAGLGGHDDSGHLTLATWILGGVGECHGVWWVALVGKHFSEIGSWTRPTDVVVGSAPTEHLLRHMAAAWARIPFYAYDCSKLATILPVDTWDRCCYLGMREGHID